MSIVAKGGKKRRVAMVAGVLSLAGALATAAHAETITLGCTGTVVLEMANELPKSAWFVVDPDAGVVSSSLGEFEITRMTPTKVDFQADFFEGQKRTGKWIGWIDRMTGAAGLGANRRAKGIQPISYRFDCQPKPLS